MADEVEMIAKASELWREGVRLSGQRTYRRRWPNEQALILFKTALELLDQIPATAASLELRSRIQENMLDYENALSSLHRAFDHGTPRDRARLKRVATLEAAAQFWRACPLTPYDLALLGRHLVARGAESGAQGDTDAGSREWLSENRPNLADEFLEFAAECGSSTDFTILQNVVR